MEISIQNKLKMKLSIFYFLSFLSIVYSVSAQSEDSPGLKPNIVIFLVDDSGLMDFGAFGGEANTPNIDQLANNGMMFTNFHTSPVCAPSRAMLLTGTDSHLAGVANLPEFLPSGYQSEPGYGGVLNNRVQTVATRLKEVGYHTYATGKWHLGHDENTLPHYRGFDRTFILGGSGANNYSTKGYLPMKPIAHWYADGKETHLPDDFYSSKDYIEHMIAFHEAEEDKTTPFFSYVAFQAIHSPLQAPKRFVEPYLDVYKEGWDVLRQKRFETAKAMGIIPANASMNGMFPQFEKWDELSEEEKDDYVTSMAVLAGMLEAVDFYIGQYLNYLKEEGLFENTIFIIASDNGPDGADYRSNAILTKWKEKNGYHSDKNRLDDKGYYGTAGPEFAHALASPFSFFKYYTGEGGVRTPLIISGKNIPNGQQSKAFCFVTDIVPTILELAGMEPMSNKTYAPITGNSLLPHIQDVSVPVYREDEGIGLEASNSSAYFKGDFKIVKNNIPLGDNKWYMYNLKTDPGETKDISKSFPDKFQAMKASYDAYAKAVGVIEMKEGYSAESVVAKKSAITILKNNAIYILGLIAGIVGLIVFLIKKRKVT